LIVMLLLASAVVAMGKLKAAPVAAPTDDAGLGVLAADLIEATRLTEGVTATSGGYLAQTGIVISTSMGDLQSSDVVAWVHGLTEPFTERLAAIPLGEALVWHVEVGGQQPFGRLVRIPGLDAGQPARWRQVVVPIGYQAIGVATSASSSDTGSDTEGDTAETTAPAAAEPSTTAATTETTVTSTESADGATATTAAAAGTAADAASATTVAAAAAGGAVSDSFDTDANWNALSGSWELLDGVYQQTDGTGFDYITQLVPSVPGEFDLQVSIRALGGAPHGGIVLGQPKRGARDGATIIDIANNGAYMRWGRYKSPGGGYEFVGGATLTPTATATDWHVLKVEVRAAYTRLFLDDNLVGEFSAVTAGGVGLVTSQAAMEFDDFSVTPA
jgi:hypothetical protein